MDKYHLNSGQVFLFIFFLALFAAVGDYFLKLASLEARPLLSKRFIVGCLIYALNAFGWVFAFRYAKMTFVGVVYSLATVLLLTIFGVVGFREKLNAYEVIGIGCAVSSIILLARFG